MPKFGKASLEKLDTLHTDLQKVLNGVIEMTDFTIIEGHRSQEKQDELFRDGKTKVRSSKHNLSPSEAVDIAPWPIDWNNRERFFYLAGIVRGIAVGLGVDIRWGGDWDSDGETEDNEFDDLPHFELRR